MIADKIEALLADKGYDADAIREELTKADVEAGIPAKSNRREPIAHDREKYRWRNRRAPVQQAQELAAHRNTIRQNQGILPRLCQSRVSPAVDTLCPRNLNRVRWQVTSGAKPAHPLLAEKAPYGLW
jgi:IS5 family transposase